MHFYSDWQKTTFVIFRLILTWNIWCWREGGLAGGKVDDSLAVRPKYTVHVKKQTKNLVIHIKICALWIRCYIFIES